MSGSDKDPKDTPTPRTDAAIPAPPRRQTAVFWRNAFFLLTGKSKELERESAALAERVRELEQDAARYRWLRSKEAAVTEICNCANPKEDGFTFMEMEELDTTIDAAMKGPNEHR